MMIMMVGITNLNYELRLFLLSLLERRERSTTEILYAVKIEFGGKYTDMNIRKMLKKLVRHSCLRKNKRTPDSVDTSEYTYVATDNGIKKKEYYQNILRNKG